jgi:hypothetical protein
VSIILSTIKGSDNLYLNTINIWPSLLKDGLQAKIHIDKTTGLSQCELQFLQQQAGLPTTETASTLKPSCPM